MNTPKVVEHANAAGENIVLYVEANSFTLTLMSGGALVYAILADGAGRQEKRIVAGSIPRLLARIVAEMPEIKSLDAQFRTGYVNEKRYAYMEVCEYSDHNTIYELRFDGGELYFVTAFTSTKVAL